MRPARLISTPPTAAVSTPGAASACLGPLGPAGSPWRTLAAARAELADLTKSASKDGERRLVEIAGRLDRIEAKFDG